MAMMVALSCKHPDIYEFLNIKQHDEKLAAMNISIKFTNEFMQAVVDNTEYELYFKVDSSGEEIKRKINARDFFNKFCEVNKDYADPGVIFIDRVQQYNLLSGYSDYQIDVSNPCAEFFGNDGNSCNLQSINLYNIVENKFTSRAEIDYKKLDKLVRLSIKMLNQALEYGYSMQPLDKNRKCIDDWRSIGLGVFGLADMFIALGVKYGSELSIDITSELFDYINKVAIDESCNLTELYGTFGKYTWEETKKSPLIELLKFGNKQLYEKVHKLGLANGTLLSIAPTGSLSLFMGGFSGGCEPLFKVSYDRTTHSTEDAGKTFKVYARSVKDLLEYNNLSLDLSTEEIKDKFSYVIESHEINPTDRVLLQAIMQGYVDNAISSTINLPEGTTAEEINSIYLFAWQQGLKGITVYVDGCKRGNILGVDKTKKDIDMVYDSIAPISRRETDEVDGKTYRLSTSCAKKMYLTINKTNDGDIFEVFANPSGGCISNVTTITRLVSMALRSGVKVNEIIDELSSSKCPACQNMRKEGNTKVSLSCGNAIADALRKAYDSGEVTDNTDGLYECPECHKKTLRLEAKCSTCSNCGYSTCN
jgi:ribonucleoside-diphosphate reductase alpha chain